MSSNPNISLLAGLVGGYNQAKDSQLHQDLAARASQRDQMLQYLGHLATAPNVPVEHQQWALQKASELAQHDITKKLPKIDLGELPPVMRQAPDRQTVTQAPGFDLKPPSAPSQVGQASNGTVNALGSGSIQMPAPPPGAAPIGPSLPPGGQTASGAPMSVAGAPTLPIVSVPPGPTQTIVNPTPPEQIAPGGAIHLTTDAERAQRNIDTTTQSINQLQRQYPMKSREDLAYFTQHGEFPKPGKEDAGFTLGPGQKRFDSEGKQIATNEDARPGGKSGYEPVMGPGGPIGVKDVATGGMLSPDEVKANPHAKAVLDQAVAMHKTALSEQEAKENRQAERQAAQQARAFAQQAKMLEARGEALTANTKSMVEAAPRVKDLSAKVRALVDAQEKTLGPMSSRWQEYMAGKIGSPNPDFTRLRTDTGLLQTLLMRMHVGARGGNAQMEHFKSLIDNAKQSPENMRAALDEIDAYADDVTKEGATAKEAAAAKAEGRTPKTVQTPKAPPGGQSATPAAGGFNWDDHPKVSN